MDTTIEKFIIKTFIIKSIGRKWITATLQDCNCKLLIDEKVKDIDIGVNTLKVKDISTSSNFGKALKFEIIENLTKEYEGYRLEDHPLPQEFNQLFKGSMDAIGGFFYMKKRVWVAPICFTEQANDILDVINSKKVPVDLIFNEDISLQNKVDLENESITFLGVSLAWFNSHKLLISRRVMIDGEGEPEELILRSYSNHVITITIVSGTCISCEIPVELLKRFGYEPEENKTLELNITKEMLNCGKVLPYKKETTRS